MTGRFTNEAELALGLSHSVEVVLYQLGKSGVLEGLGKGDLLLVELPHFLLVLGVIPLLFLLLVYLLQDLDLRVGEGRLPWGLCGLPCYPEPTSIRVGNA